MSLKQIRVAAALALLADPIINHTATPPEYWPHSRKPSGKDRSKVKAARKQRRQTNSKHRNNIDG